MKPSKKSKKPYEPVLVELSNVFGEVDTTEVQPSYSDDAVLFFPYESGTDGETEIATNSDDLDCPRSSTIWYTPNDGDQRPPETQTRERTSLLFAASHSAPHRPVPHRPKRLGRTASTFLSALLLSLRRQAIRRRAVALLLVASLFVAVSVAILRGGGSGATELSSSSSPRSPRPPPPATPPSRPTASPPTSSPPMTTPQSAESSPCVDEYDDVNFDTIVSTIGNATSWCRRKNLMLQHDCGCTNPVMPQEYVAPPSERLVRRWRTNSHITNVHLANGAASKGNVDVVFLGDSITEHWRGVHHDAPPQDDHLQAMINLFESLFTKEGGGEFEGLPLAIFNDRTPQLLWRLQNGEMPPGLNPKVWWILIGMHDLSGDGCSPSSVLAGIVRIVQEILSKKPNATVVVNGILPRIPPPKAGSFDSYTFWADASWVNDRMDCYARSSKDDGIEFHDASDMFLDDANDRHPDPSLYEADGVHPSLTGYALWGESIVKKLKTLIL